LTEQSIQALARRFGAGRLFSVPANTANAQHIEEVIGLEQTSRLVEEFGGNHCYLPGLDRPRNGGVPLAKVRKTLHLSAFQQSRRLGCSVRTIFDKRRQIREEGDKVSCGKPNRSVSVGKAAL
jgi:hypothetical protein